MRDPKRIDLLLGRLKDLWVLYPDFRLGQLICTAVRKGNLTVDIREIEDEDLLKGIERLLPLCVEAQDGCCRTCKGALQIISADGAGMTVRCVFCGSMYRVAPDAFGRDQRLQKYYGVALKRAEM